MSANRPIKRRNTKGNKPIVNGIILAALTVFLGVYFSLNGKWNVATVFVIILMCALSAFQFWIYFRLFKEK